jgi:hypothetical protein
MITKQTQLPHTHIANEEFLVTLNKVIFKLSESGQDFEILNLIRDRNFELDTRHSSRMLNYWDEKGYVFAGRNGERGKRRFSLIDALNLEHAIISDNSRGIINKLDQDSIMHVGFEKFQNITAMEFFILVSISLFGVRDIHLNRDFTNYKSGYVKQYISFEISDLPQHEWIMNISQTVIEKLVDINGKLSMKHADVLAKQILDLVISMRKKLKIQTVHLDKKAQNHGIVLEELIATKPINYLSRSNDILLKTEDQDLIGINITYLGKSMTVIPDDEKYIEHNLDEILERLRSKIRTMIKRNRGIPKDEFIKMLEDSPKPNKESS